MREITARYPAWYTEQAVLPFQSIPETFVIAERLTHLIHKPLATHNLGNWLVLGQISKEHFSNIQVHLGELTKSKPIWTPLPLAIWSTGLSNQFKFTDQGQIKLKPSGCLMLRDRHVALFRWYRFAPIEGCFHSLCWAATRSPSDFDKLIADVTRLCKCNVRPEWQVFTGGRQGETIPRDKNLTWDHLILDPVVKTRVEEEVVGFFNEPTHNLFKELGLAHRRGVLLWGPPGNGKTSVIRVAAALNPSVAAFFLQPGPKFDDDDLKDLIERWRDEAPAMLVIEDLDWLLTRIRVSTFLNMLDGIDQRYTGGLLLIATTNHPERLDPAINNRPGRFDAVIEVRWPTDEMRLAYFEKFAPGLSQPTLRELVSHTSGQSFAHLREVILRSGYNSLRQGRSQREESDYLEAAWSVRAGTSIASGGFSVTSGEGFGFLNRTNSSLVNKGSS
ncbi:MAG: AAA family ATPase [Phycisphaerae bacterium]